MSTWDARHRFATLALALLLAPAAAPAGEGWEATPAAGAEGNGLRLLRPYERGKVPVVLVHGLWGSPAQWGRMIEALEADPVIRARYQVWTYAYPTGDPIPESAARLAEALRRARDGLDPCGEDAALDRPILVGHSLGGLLSKAVASGNVAGGPAVGRVVYIAVPHRGSPLAAGLTGRVGTRLLRPRDFASIRPVGARSIDQLAPGHAALEALSGAPSAARPPFHSILADLGGPTSAGTDGVVPYDSAHLEGAASERVVPGGHLCLDRPEVAREVGRILRLHADAPAAPVLAASR